VRAADTTEASDPPPSDTGTRSGSESLAHPHRDVAHPHRDEIHLTAVLHALSDPMRLLIVRGLAEGHERTCKSFDLPVVKSTCTHHFRVLRDAGVIRQRPAGTTRACSLRREDLDARFPGLVDAVLRGAALSD
jgi:DNA-binding transcriptional ArsR family regulator